MIVTFFFGSLFGIVAILLICLLVWAYKAWKENKHYLNELTKMNPND